jgi:hypothetical protein
VFPYRNLSASVFVNESKTGGSFLAGSLQRVQGRRRRISALQQFTRNEIPVARHLLAKVWDFILDAKVK